MNGTLIIVGIGPGDPDLLTLKAVKAIQSADLIAYPAANEGESLARKIAAPHIPKNTQEYAFQMPMRIDRKPGQDAYDAAAAHLETVLASGHSVALLCEGDPFFYGSAMYLFERLKKRFACEIIPGITSINACSAAIKRPLCARNEKLKVIPAPMDELEMKHELSSTESAAIMKVGRHFDKVRRILREIGADENAVVVEAASSTDEKITKLNDYPEGERPYFSTVLVYRGNEDWESCT